MFSWALTFILLTITPILLSGLLMKLYFIKKTSIFIIWTNILLYNLNILSMALLFQHFCDDVRSGQTLLKILYIGVSFLSIPLSSEQVPILLRYCTSIFPQVVLGYSFEVLILADVI
jgi:hypothetical protein